jgi:hypothetical protein
MAAVASIGTCGRCNESANGVIGEIATQGAWANYLGRQRTHLGLGKSDSEANGQCGYEIRHRLRHDSPSVDLDEFRHGSTVP